VIEFTWPVITIAVTNLSTLAVVIAGAYYRIKAMKNHNDAVLEQFREQNVQLDRVEKSARTVAAVTPILVKAANATLAP
jgi:hypothetical protein